MGTWGYRAFENDAACDWLYDLEEAKSTSFLFAPLRRAIRTKGAVDIDDAIESLAAAELLAAARHEIPRGLPREAIKSIHRLGVSPSNADLRLAISAIQKISADSELRDSWRDSGNLSKWQKALGRLQNRLRKALTLPILRRAKQKIQERETLAELIIRVSKTKDSALRASLREKLNSISDVNRPVAAKGFNAVTPLHWVATCNLLPEARLLLARGAKVDAYDAASAVKHNYPAMVQLLLASGADKGYALHAAVECNCVRILKMLLQTKVDRATRWHDGGTLLHAAAYAGSTASIKFLLRQKFNVHARDDSGDTPLHWAVDFCHFSAAKALVEAGANPALRNKAGKTVFDLAVEAKEVEPRIARLLSKSASRS